MLPHYSALKVAEQFRVLEAIAPGRIDLGVGSAPGSDRRTAYALNPNDDMSAEQFPRQVLDLRSWVSGAPLDAESSVRGHRRASARTDVAGALDPRQFQLRRGARRALRAAVCVRVFLQRRQGRRGGAATSIAGATGPVARHPAPQATVCILALAADTDAEARRLLQTREFWRVGLRARHPRAAGVTRGSARGRLHGRRPGAHRAAAAACVCRSPRRRRGAAVGRGGAPRARRTGDRHLDVRRRGARAFVCVARQGVRVERCLASHVARCTRLGVVRARVAGPPGVGCCATGRDCGCRWRGCARRCHGRDACDPWCRCRHARARRGAIRPLGRNRPGAAARLALALRVARNACTALMRCAPARRHHRLRSDRRVGLEALDDFARDRLLDQRARCRAAGRVRRCTPATPPGPRRRRGRCGRCDAHSPRRRSAVRN